jgi:hypothetical protein
MAPSIRKKLAITSPTSGDRSVGIVRSRTQTKEFLVLFNEVFIVSLLDTEQFERLREAVLFTNKVMYLYLTLVCALRFAELWDDEVFTFVFFCSALPLHS